MANLCLKVPHKILAGNKSLPLHLLPPFLSLSYLLLSFLPMCGIGKALREQHKPAAQPERQVWGPGGGKNPTAEGQPKSKPYIHPVPCGYLHQHHTMTPPPQKLPPAQTAREGNVPFLFIGRKAEQFIQGLGRGENH